MFDIPVKTKAFQIYCHPIVGDTHLVRCRLDGDNLTLERVPIALTMIQLFENPDPGLEKFNALFAGFDEVSPEEFAEIAEKYASQESLKSFKEKWVSIYGRR